MRGDVVVSADRPPAIPSEESVCVMFSGGLDSTVVALEMCRVFRRVALLTVDFPMTVGLGNAVRNVKGLRAAFPGVQIEHHVVDGDQARKRIWKTLPDDYFDHCRGRGLGLTCLGCKTAMLVETVKFCLAERIGHAANGMTRTQSNHPDCLPEIVNRFGDFLAEYGIVYINPVYEARSRIEELNLLREHGLSQGVRIGASSVTHQPRCFVGPYTKLWLEAAPVEAEDMVSYFDGKARLLREIIAPHAQYGPVRGRPEMRTRVPAEGRVTVAREFGPWLDRTIALLMTPVWWISRVVLRLRRRKS